MSNKCLSNEPGACGHLHAEINALIKMPYESTNMSRMYVTTQPCYTCAVAIVNANIGEVVYGHKYRDMSGLELLWKCFQDDVDNRVRQFLPVDAT